MAIPRISGFTRAALVGTAPSWRHTPWDDPGIYIVSLNDAYSLRTDRGETVKRANAWYDIHPFDEMWFRPKDKHEFKEGEIPEGKYIRPEGHLEWLQARAATMDVWVRQVPDGWPPNAKTFPIDDIKLFLKARPDQECYSSSSPAPILAHLYLQGFTEIHIYGIHLATQQEWAYQRPNFEWLIGRLEERGVNIVLPPECPLLKHTHVYAYEKAPVRPDLPALQRKHRVQAQMNKLAQELVVWPRWKSKAKAFDQMARLRAELRDAQMEGRHALLSQGV